MGIDKPTNPPTDYAHLPPNLPAPQDDGAAAHLVGLELPHIDLPSTSGRLMALTELPAPRVVLFCYPMTGRPGVPLPPGWDMIPGARGCTLEACGFRDHAAEFARLGAAVFGISTQSTDEQREAAARLKLPFELLSDERLALATAIRLPTFEVEGRTLLKRLTLILCDRRIERVFYPIFPPDRHADEVVACLSMNAGE